MEDGSSIESELSDVGLQGLSDDDFNLSAYITYLGKDPVKNEGIYLAYVAYEWVKQPYYAYSDKFGVSFQYGTTAWGSPSSTHFWYPNGINYTPVFAYTNEIDKEFNYGSAWKLDLISGPWGAPKETVYQHGMGAQEFRAPASWRGTTSGSIEISYGHRWGSPVGGLSVSLGWGTISISAVLSNVTEYQGRINFNY